jgi:putative nucleotidyltransferase with HDIG domain
LFGARKKKALKRVKPERMADRTVPANGERASLMLPALILLIFTLLTVLVEQILCLVRTGLPLAPVRLVGYLFLVCLGVFIAGGYLFTFVPKVFEKKLRLFNFGLLCLIFVAAGRALLLPQVHVPQFLTPVSVLAILLVVLYSQRLAVVGALSAAFVISMNPQYVKVAQAFDFQLFAVNAAGAFVGIFAARRMDTRTRLIKVGFLVGLGHAAGLLFTHLVLGAPADSGWQFPKWANIEVLEGLGWCLASGVGAGFVLSGALPFVERIFRLTTDIRLKELSDLNQPILRRFLIEAPGSYHHSLIVGTLSEAAAQRIGANPLLARVGAYFHDVGKLNKPDYFTENESIKGAKHATLSPTMSTLIIIAHVKDGVEIAQDLNLPNEVISIIREHHGTSLIEYFYREALEERRREDGEQVEDQLFRYPGPKPSSREAAIVHLADVVEATTRTLGEPSPSRIEEVVSESVRRRLNDGQLDESGLTLTDITRIKETFTRVLMGIFHTRIKYQKESSLK